MSQPDPFVDVDVLEIRSAFFKRHCGGGDMNLVKPPNEIKCKNSRDPTHELLLISQCANVRIS